MTQPLLTRKRARRNEHVSRFFLETSHRHPFPRAQMDNMSTAIMTSESQTSFSSTKDSRQPPSTSFDVLSVEPRSTSIRSEKETRTDQRTSSRTHSSESTGQTNSFVTSTYTISMPVETGSSTTWEQLAQLQVEPTTSIRRTTLFLPATFALPSSSPSLSSMVTSSVLIAPLSAVTHQSITWTRATPSATSSHSASATASSAAHVNLHHTHISPALIVFMAIAGFFTLAISLYLFRRARYNALHVSRSQFQLASPNGHDGSTGVSGSESDKSFISGGLGLLGHSHKHKDGHLDASAESPLWGGREKFSPHIGDGILDFPPPAHLHTNERVPGSSRRRSVVDTIRRNVPGRLSKYGAGWDTITEAPVVPTFKITDMDTTNHRRGASGSTFSESPDPNLASIQVASVARPLSATASYASSPLPVARPNLEHPRPAPKVPPRSPARQVAPGIQVPPVPMLPDISGSTTGQKKLVDTSNRGKIDVADISKPLPALMLPQPEMTIQGSRAVGEGDPMAMYTKYSVGLGVRNESSEMVRRETSMAQKIAQIANSNSSSRPTLAPTGSQSSIAKRDTRALAAAAGLASAVLSDERVFSGVDKQQALGNLPGTPGLANVGNVMLRPYGQSGSMIPAYLETPAIGLDGRTSYLSAKVGGPEVEWRNRPGASTGPQDAKVISRNEVATLHRSATDESDRRTILSQYSQDFVPLSQQAHIHQNPDYHSPTYSIYNYYDSSRVSRMPSLIHAEQREPQVGGAL
ncbi:hypothetical protein RSOLAG22IIIB_01587 [Rhizoctonia solani]|uniref:Uncharacterized protein n=1 Tax=Rhizoctonia solani TaxID=456999 RepID=A0A0K6G8M2_9AGAM|nr:hypothetical protein RSOLAG22IIIB_01587 [Rhizoctonia solani]